MRFYLFHDGSNFSTASCLCCAKAHSSLVRSSSRYTPAFYVRGDVVRSVMLEGKQELYYTMKGIVFRFQSQLVVLPHARATRMHTHRNVHTQASCGIATAMASVAHAKLSSSAGRSRRARLPRRRPLPAPPPRTALRARQQSTAM
jgi:hypothetical protein